MFCSFCDVCKIKMQLKIIVLFYDIHMEPDQIKTTSFGTVFRNEIFELTVKDWDLHCFDT